MKKTITLLVLLLSVFVFSQEFVLTENNLKSKENVEKDYIVLDYPDKSKNDLFYLVKKYFTTSYKGIKEDGYNEVLNEQIVSDILSSSSRTMFINIKGSNIWKASIRYEINFKDNKIMIRPSFSHFSNTMNSSTATIGVLFNSSGKIRKEKGVYFVEDLVNTFIRDLKKGIDENKSNDW